MNNMGNGLKWLSNNKIEVNTVIDVGASNGCWTKECLFFYPKADYILFEPQPCHSDSLDIFVKNLKQNIKVIKKAVGSSEGETFFDASEPFGGALAQSEFGNKIIKVDLTTIDSNTSDLKGPYLIKLDTHGYERSIIEGSKNTLNQTNVLIIESYNYRISNEAFLFWELCSYLNDKGFRPIYIADILNREVDYSLWQMDIFFIRSNWEGFNYTAYK
jgi:FkbM family methyltransferase